MRKFLLTLMASLASFSAASAFWPEAADSSLEIGVGYRVDHLNWKTNADFSSSASCYSSGSGSGYSSGYSYGSGSENQDRGVSSELKWRSLRIWQLEAEGKYVTCDNIYLRAKADYGWITSGKNTDRDFSRNGEEVSTTEFNRTHSKTKGHVYDVDLAIGYEFKLCDDSFSIIPLIGYSWKGQHLKDHGLETSYAVVPEVPVNSEVRSQSNYYSSDYNSYGSYSGYSYSGEHSKYNTRWNGPFVGFDFNYRFYCDWALFGTYEYHWGQYHANGDWALRRLNNGQDLQNGFRHHAKRVSGNDFDIGLKWDFCECWTAYVKGEFQYFEAKHGRDRARVIQATAGNVKTDCYVSQKLEHVKWHSEAISLGLGAVF